MTANNTRQTILSLTPTQLSSLSPWTIAAHYGIGYSGDINPIDHGGYFYSTQDWTDNGYSSVIEFYTLCDDDPTPSLHVQEGTINLPELETLEQALDCCGLNPDQHSDTLAQIECVRDYCGIEPGDTSHRWPDVDNVDEDDVWLKTEPMLRFLSPYDVIGTTTLARQCGLSPDTPLGIIFDRASELGLLPDDTINPALSE